MKVYDNLTLLERNIKIITILDDLGIPVGKIVPTAENTMKIYQFVDDNEDKIMKSIYDVWKGDM
ncbi:MAG: hypothetical protein IJA10_04560 [Lachnospiraceae bacterium]|nr:hypothetical protein [Lachnospiraceae bacterium]